MKKPAANPRSTWPLSIFSRGRGVVSRALQANWGQALRTDLGPLLGLLSSGSLFGRGSSAILAAPATSAGLDNLAGAPDLARTTARGQIRTETRSRVRTRLSSRTGRSKAGSLLQGALSVLLGALLWGGLTGCSHQISPSSLQVGQCFNASDGVLTNSQPANQISTLSCRRAHNSEVIGIHTLEDSDLTESASGNSTSNAAVGSEETEVENSSINPASSVSATVQGNVQGSDSNPGSDQGNSPGNTTKSNQDASEGGSSAGSPSSTQAVGADGSAQSSAARSSSSSAASIPGTGGTDDLDPATILAQQTAALCIADFANYVGADYQDTDWDIYPINTLITKNNSPLQAVICVALTLPEREGSLKDAAR